MTRLNANSVLTYRLQIYLLPMGVTLVPSSGVVEVLKVLRLFRTTDNPIKRCPDQKSLKQHSVWVVRLRKEVPLSARICAGVKILQGSVAGYQGLFKSVRTNTELLDMSVLEHAGAHSLRSAQRSSHLSGDTHARACQLIGEHRLQTIRLLCQLKVQNSLSFMRLSRCSMPPDSSPFDHQKGAQQSVKITSQPHTLQSMTFLSTIEKSKNKFLTAHLHQKNKKSIILKIIKITIVPRGRVRNILSCFLEF